MYATKNFPRSFQKFLGVITCMAPFIQNLADKAAPIREMLKKNAEFRWEQHHEKCFQTLKEAISEDAILAYFNTKVTPTLETDAS